MSEQILKKKDNHYCGGRSVIRIYKCQHLKKDGSICGRPTARTLCFLHEYLQRNNLKHNWKINMHTHDCNYITRKGTRCKIPTSQEFCHYHRVLIATGKTKYFLKKEKLLIVKEHEQSVE